MKKFDEAFQRLNAYNKFKKEIEKGEIMNYDYKMIENAISNATEERITYSNYDYKGQVKDGKENGYGGKVYKDGNGIETGFYLNSRLHGFGILIYADGSSYSGEWKENQQHGQGIKTWKKSQGKVAVYKGSYDQGRRHGHGTYTTADGDIYVGNWVNNKRHGQGKMTYKESGKVEEGEWKDDKFIG